MLTNSNKATSPEEEVVVSDYSIEQKSGRFIVWRLANNNKYRQGSFCTYEEANNRISNSIENMNC